MRRTLDKRLKEDDVAESRRAIVMLRSSKAVILHEAVPARLATAATVTNCSGSSPRKTREEANRFKGRIRETRTGWLENGVDGMEQKIKRGLNR